MSTVAYCKMTTFIYLAFVVLSFSLPLVGLAQNTSTTSTGIENAPNQNMTMALNLTNASCNSDLRIDKSAVENILRLSHHYATHVIEIRVSVNSGNETQELKWSWAAEIGRTIISLKSSLSQDSILPISSFHFITLNPGIKEVNVVVENYGCLPNGSKGSEVIFDFLLHQLFSPVDNDDYKLCRVISENDDVKIHNCCRVASGGNLMICDEYSSVLLEYAKYYTFTMVFIMIYVGCPLIQQHLQSITRETEHYSITYSPMALSRIFYAVFLQGSNNPVTPYYRRLTFSLFTVVLIISLSTFSWPWIISSFTWALLFTVYDIFWLNRGNIENIERYLKKLTLPFNFKKWWKRFKRLTNRQHVYEEELQVTTCTYVCSIITHFFKALLFVLTYTVCVIPFCVFSIGYYSPFVIFQSSGFQRNERNVPRGMIGQFCVWLGFLVLYVFSFTIITTFFLSFLNLSLNLIIGLYLNGSYFSPKVVPVIILLGYSWKDWRSFVETKYLQLKTAIYECCEEYYEKNSSQDDASVPTTSLLTTEIIHQESEATTDHWYGIYVVNVKEGTVSKALYDKIREHKLPYYKVLFYFSIRMFLVANFSLIVFVMMSLAQKSNIDVPVQIISTIAVSTFPLIFETIWADHSFEQKNVNRKKLKQELSLIMQMKIKDDDTVSVYV